MKNILIVFALFLPFVCLAESVDINSATLQELDELTGIGPAYAQRIIDGRPYSSVDDLERVKGIGPTTLQKIKDQGFACVNCATVIASEAKQSPAPSPAPTPWIATPSASPEASARNDTLVVAAATVYPTGVYINEVLPNPQGADETDEWIEIYNSNNFAVDLSAWQLQDTNGTVSSYSFGSGVNLAAGGFLVVTRPQSHIMLNNQGDGINLLHPNGKVADSISFSDAPLGQSYSLYKERWQWSSNPTPGQTNAIIAPKTIIKTSKISPSPLPNEEKNDNNKAITELAAASLSTGSGSSNPWLMFLLAGGTVIFLGIISLIIKFKLTKHVGS